MYSYDLYLLPFMFVCIFYILLILCLILFNNILDCITPYYNRIRNFKNNKNLNKIF